MRVFIVPRRGLERVEDSLEFGVLALQQRSSRQFLDHRGEQSRDSRRSFLQEGLHDSPPKIGRRGMRPQSFQLRRDFREARGHGAPRLALFRFEAPRIRQQHRAAFARRGVGFLFFRGRGQRFEEAGHHVCGHAPRVAAPQCFPFHPGGLRIPEFFAQNRHAQFVVLRAAKPVAFPYCPLGRAPDRGARAKGQAPAELSGPR